MIWITAWPDVLRASKSISKGPESTLIACGSGKDDSKVQSSSAGAEAPADEPVDSSVLACFEGVEGRELAETNAANGSTRA